jgi:hypothetical protein
VPLAGWRCEVSLHGAGVFEHASVTTTERYLGVRQDLTHALCDHLGLTIEVSR